MPAARGRHPKPACLGGARSYYRPERWARERLIHTRRAGAGHPHLACRPCAHLTSPPASWTLGTASALQTARGIVARRAETPLGGSGRPRLRPSRARSPPLRGRARVPLVLPVFRKWRSGQAPGLLAQGFMLPAIPGARDSLGEVASKAGRAPAPAFGAKMLEGLALLLPDNTPAAFIWLVGRGVGERSIVDQVIVTHGGGLMRGERRRPARISVSDQRFNLEERFRVN